MAHQGHSSTITAFVTDDHVQVVDGSSQWMVNRIKTEPHDIGSINDDHIEDFLDVFLQVTDIDVKEEEEPVAVHYEVTSEDHFVDMEDPSDMCDEKNAVYIEVEEETSQDKSHKKKSIKKELNNEPDQDTFSEELTKVLVNHNNTISNLSKIPSSILDVSNDTPLMKKQKNLVLQIFDLPYQCEVCELRCKTKRNLLSHSKLHTDPKEYLCSLCLWCGRGRTKFLAHIKAHYGQRLFNCSLCGYKSSHRGHILRHLQGHQGQVLLRCNLCDKRCIGKRTLAQHKLAAHGPPPPLQCSQCDYTATNKQKMERHLRTHTGEKPFPCPYCNHRSGRLDHLKTHIKTHPNVSSNSVIKNRSSFVDQEEPTSSSYRNVSIKTLPNEPKRTYPEDPINNLKNIRVYTQEIKEETQELVWVADALLNQ